jgi:DUF1680 family protein
MGETCASVAMMMFTWRMHAITGKSRQFDIIENTLYNHFLGAIALDGLGHFYYNPMRVVGDQSHRSDHGHRPATARCMLPEINRTACCMPNCWRFLGALPEYVFSHDDDGLFVNLYTTSRVSHSLPDGRDICLSVRTEYPHQGCVRIRFEGNRATRFKLRLRIPGWCNKATAAWPKQPKRCVEGGEYLVIDRVWTRDDAVDLVFDMPVRIIHSHPRVHANAGQVVFARGPILFCLEKEDVDFPVENARIPLAAQDLASQTRAQWHPELLGGIHILHAPGLVDGRRVELALVPWYVRANRSQDSRWVIYLPLTQIPR